MDETALLAGIQDRIDQAAEVIAGLTAGITTESSAVTEARAAIERAQTELVGDDLVAEYTRVAGLLDDLAERLTERDAAMAAEIAVSGLDVP